MSHEEETLKAFILPQRRERYLAFLRTKKGRAKLTSALAHFNALDPRWLVPIRPNQQNVSSIAKLLASKGAGSKCSIISENSKLDAQEMELVAALNETVGHGWGTIISCIPGRLAYFEDEDSRYILQR